MADLLSQSPFSGRSDSDMLEKKHLVLQVMRHKALLAGGLIQTVQRQDPFQNKPLQRGLPKILLFEKLSFLPSCNSQSLENKNIHETKTYSQTLCKAKQALKSPILLSP